MTAVELKQILIATHEKVAILRKLCSLLRYSEAAAMEFVAKQQSTIVALQKQIQQLQEDHTSPSTSKCGADARRAHHGREPPGKNSSYMKRVGHSLRVAYKSTSLQAHHNIQESKERNDGLRTAPKLASVPPSPACSTRPSPRAQLG